MLPLTITLQRRSYLSVAGQLTSDIATVDEPTGGIFSTTSEGLMDTLSYAESFTAMISPEFLESWKQCSA
jgi:hypothetical protein